MPRGGRKPGARRPSHGWRLARARRVLAAGGVVAYPTEAVFGLGCDPRSGAAVWRILALKRRDPGLGLILIGAMPEHVSRYLAPLDGGGWSAGAWERALGTWPGPTTWLLPAARDAAAILTGGRDTLAVRVTAHPLAAALCRAFGGALVSTSANLSGRPPARTALGVRRRFGARLDLILAGATGGAHRPSEIRDGRSAAVIRPGGV